MKISNQKKRPKEKSRRPDLQLSFWKNWGIFDPAKGECLINFLPNIDISTPAGLLQGLKEVPNIALYSVHIGEIAASESPLAAAILKEIKKAGRRDRRAQRFERENFQQDLVFFLKVLERPRGVKIDDVIENYCENLEDDQSDNLWRIYKAYLKVYKQLREKLTINEAIHFLSIAGARTHLPFAYEGWKPDERPLIYAKGIWVLYLLREYEAASQQREMAVKMLNEIYKAQ